MPDRNSKSTYEAREQAAEHYGFAAAAYIEVEGGEEFEIPSPAMIDDDLELETEETDDDDLDEQRDDVIAQMQDW